MFVLAEQNRNKTSKKPNNIHKALDKIMISIYHQMLRALYWPEKFIIHLCLRIGHFKWTTGIGTTRQSSWNSYQSACITNWNWHDHLTNKSDLSISGSLRKHRAQRSAAVNLNTPYAVQEAVPPRLLLSQVPEHKSTLALSISLWPPRHVTALWFTLDTH